jgi:hypothetical protein
MPLEQSLLIKETVSGQQKRRCHFYLSEPEYRALKNLAYSHGNSVDEEIEHAVYIWRKNRRSERELDVWSKTEHKFQCFHDAVEMSSCSEYNPNLIEAAIRRHIHDFDIKSEFQNYGCRFEETQIVTLQIDASTADRIWSLKRTSGASLSCFVNDAIKQYNRRFGKLRNESEGATSEIAPSLKQTPRNRISDSRTLHVHLNSHDINELRNNMQLEKKDVERAIMLIINWKVTKAFPSQIHGY